MYKWTYKYLLSAYLENKSSYFNNHSPTCKSAIVCQTNTKIYTTDCSREINLIVDCIKINQKIFTSEVNKILTIYKLENVTVEEREKIFEFTLSFITLHYFYFLFTLSIYTNILHVLSWISLIQVFFKIY